MGRIKLKNRIQSFGYAWKGIRSFVTQEHNAWIELAIAVFTLIAGYLFEIRTIEWIAVIFCIGMVLAAEAINTAIERLVDMVSPEKNPSAGNIKDIAAGAVLICSIAAIIIGIIIFLPYVLRLFGFPIG